MTGIFRSEDLGLTWEFIVPHETPSISRLYINNHVLYAGTWQDEDNNAHLYKMNLSDICDSGDLDCSGSVDRGDVDIIKNYKNYPATECLRCDLDSDGKITVLDMRLLVMKCTCPQCTCPQ
jgi:hypothetical protein